MDELYDRLWPPRSPTIRPKKKMKKTPRNMLEAAVKRECMQWLVDQENVVYVERRNTGALTTVSDSFIRFGQVGAADIFCLIRPPGEWDGRLLTERPYWRNVPIPFHVEIECKRRDGKGRLSGAQREFKQYCDAIGVPYFVVTSAADLEKKLSHFLP